MFNRLKNWMALNFLQVNTEKTEVVIIGQSSSKNLIELALNKVFPNNKQVVRNWGIYFDTNLNFEFHVKKLVQSVKKYI